MVTIIKKIENAVTKVAEFHNINVEKFYEYIDKEVLEQLGEKWIMAYQGSFKLKGSSKTAGSPISASNFA